MTQWVLSIGNIVTCWFCQIVTYLLSKKRPFMKTWKTLFPTSFPDYVWDFPMLYSCLSIPFTGPDYFMWWCIANLLCSSIGITLYSPPMLEPWMQNVFHCAQFTMHIVIPCGVNCQCFNDHLGSIMIHTLYRLVALREYFCEAPLGKLLSFFSNDMHKNLVQPIENL